MTRKDRFLAQAERQERPKPFRKISSSAPGCGCSQPGPEVLPWPAQGQLRVVEIELVEPELHQAGGQRPAERARPGTARPGSPGCLVQVVLGRSTGSGSGRAPAGSAGCRAQGGWSPGEQVPVQVEPGPVAPTGPTPADRSAELVVAQSEVLQAGQAAERGRMPPLNWLSSRNSQVSRGQAAQAGGEAAGELVAAQGEALETRQAAKLGWERAGQVVAIEVEALQAGRGAQRGRDATGQRAGSGSTPEGQQAAPAQGESRRGRLRGRSSCWSWGQVCQHSRERPLQPVIDQDEFRNMARGTLHAVPVASGLT